MIRLHHLCIYLLTASLLVHTAEITTTNVVTLSENQSTDVKVADVQCTDGSNLVVNGSISPTAFCTFCFVVEPTNVATGTYEVMFYPSVATLTFAQVPEYDITLTCYDLDNSTNFVSEILEIRITPNSAPTFTNGLTDQQTIPNTKDKVAGEALFTVAATDPNSDAIFYTLTRTDPTSDNFQIGFTDGIISAVNDLNTQCTQEIDLYVTITDGNIEVGPQVIDVTLQDSNDVPVIDNTDDTISLAEDTAVDTSIVTISFTDDTTGAALSFTTSPAAAADLFTLDVDELKLASTLDFEDTSLRRPLVLFTVDDGGCTSTTFTYTVSVTNVNEAPVIGPEDNIYDVYEGDIELDPGWTTADPDFGDSLTYSITASTPTSANFDIAPDSGLITSIVEYDVDQGAMTATVTLTIQVADEDGLTDTTTVIISIKDANDNDPEFTDLDQYFTVSSCNTVGSMLGTVAATDLDSDFQDNNVVTYSKSGGSSLITITPGGDIILNSIPSTGTSETFTVVATDNGQHPGSLSSVISATVTVAGIDCTTTTTTTTTAASVTTTATTTTTDGTNANGDDENVPWIIMAALLGTVFVGLTAWLCLTRAMRATGKLTPKWMRSCQCKGGDQGCCQRRKPPRPQIRPARPQQVKPQVQPPNGNPGFWTERFPDDNYRYKDPNRNQIPEPANYDPLPTTYQDAYVQEQGIPQRRPDTAPRALREQMDRDFFDTDALDNRNTGRVWTSDQYTTHATVGPAQGRGQDYNWAYNDDRMDGIL